MSGSQGQQGSATHTGYQVGVTAAAMVANFYLPGSGMAVQLAGALVGSVLFPAAKQKVRGPRVEDLNVTSSTYGQRIPYVYGNMRVNGNIIWSSSLKEHTDTNTTGGKGMGGAAVQTINYRYTADVAVALCEGEAQDVLRIWADQKLIYDKTKTSATAVTELNNLSWKFYSGSETQLPDPIMEARDGVGNVPAHRGLCYIMFRDLDLTPFGNRIPAFSAEVAKQAPTQANPITVGYLTTGYQNTAFSVDWANNHGYLVYYNDAVDNGITQFDLTTLTPIQSVNYADIGLNSTADWVHAGATSEYLYVADGLGDAASRIIRLDKLNLSGSGTQFAPADVPVQPVAPQLDTGFFFARHLWEVPVLGTTLVEWYCVAQGFNGDMAVLGTAMEYVWSRDNPHPGNPQARGLVGPMSVDVGRNYVYAVACEDGDSTVYIDKIKIDAGAAFVPAVGMVNGYSVGVSTEEFTVDIRAIEPDVTKLIILNVAQPSYDAVDGGIIIQLSTYVNLADTNPNHRLFKWRDGEILWSVPLVSTPVVYGAGLTQSRLRRDVYAYGVTVLLGDPSGTFFVKYDTRTGELLGYETGPGWNTYDVTGGQSYDSDTHSVVSSEGGVDPADLIRMYGGHVTPASGELLSSIVTDLCGRAGITSSEIDVSQLTDTVRGFLVDGQTSVRSALEPLAGVFHWDPIESEDLIRFKKRGAASVATLFEADLGLNKGDKGEPLGAVIETRIPETELPERVALTYIDRDRDYQQGIQSQKRAREPLPTTFARSEANVDVPVVLTASEAKSAAEIFLRNAWTERTVVGLTLPWKYLGLEPTDTILVTLDNGTVYQLRITKVEVGANFTIEAETVTNRGTRYIAAQTADSGSGFAQSLVLSTNPATRGFVIDMPLLRPTDDPGGSGSNLYYALGGIGQTGWAGAAIYRSNDGVTYDSSAWASNSTEAPWGYTTAAMPAVSDMWSTDEVGVVYVSMVTENDQMASVTQVEMLNGANAAVILNTAGEPEIFQFRDVTINGSVFELRGLLRGRRGTDAFVGNHPAGSRFLLLDTPWMNRKVNPASDIGVARFYKSVGFGGLIEDAVPVGITSQGRDLKPYAVANIASTGNPGDVTITWSRRTRWNGELMDGTGSVPLGEAVESYEIDVRAVGSPTVLNTYTATAETYTYTAVDQGTDFGVIPASCEIDIYQMSAVVGRGFRSTKTIALL